MKGHGSNQGKVGGISERISGNSSDGGRMVEAVADTGRCGGKTWGRVSGDSEELIGTRRAGGDTR